MAMRQRHQPLQRHQRQHPRPCPKLPVVANPGAMAATVTAVAAEVAVIAVMETGTVNAKVVATETVKGTAKAAPAKVVAVAVSVQPKGAHRATPRAAHHATQNAAPKAKPAKGVRTVATETGAMVIAAAATAKRVTRSRA